MEVDSQKGLPPSLWEGAASETPGRLKAFTPEEDPPAAGEPATQEAELVAHSGAEEDAEAGLRFPAFQREFERRRAARHAGFIGRHGNTG